MTPGIDVAFATKPTHLTGAPGDAYRTQMPLTPGMAASVTRRVEEIDTAIAFRSGDVPVIATPRVVALAEEATVAAVAGALPPGRTTVGSAVRLTHLAPSPVGAAVTADVVLESIEGRRLVFRVSVADGRGLVAAGYITRVVVERERFLDRAREGA
jgi:fluoroacetyl-CoA thioesterase